MQKLNQELTREFLQTKGIKFMGSYWGNENCTFQLTASDKENTWIVYIPEIPVGFNQPEPIHDYHGLLMLYLQQFSGFLKKDQGSKLVGVQQGQPNIPEAMAKYFAFDTKLAFQVMLSPLGAQMGPGNEYTMTIMQGEETEFKILYTYNGSEEVEFCTSVNRNCMSKSYAENCIAEENKLNKEDVIIQYIFEKVNDKFVSFFGAGFVVVQSNR